MTVLLILSLFAPVSLGASSSIQGPQLPSLGDAQPFPKELEPRLPSELLRQADQKKKPDEKKPDEKGKGKAKKDEDEEKPDKELPPEDEEETQRITDKIRRGLKQLAMATESSYDGKVATLVYRESIQGVAELFGRNDPKHFNFHRESGRDWSRGLHYCFSGNTLGSLHLRPVFEGAIRLNVTVEIPLVERSPLFLLRLHSTEKEFLGTDLGVHLVHKKAKKRKPKYYRTPVKRYRDTPMKWFHRTDEIKLSVAYDPAKKTLECYYRGAKIQSVEVKDAPERGQIGFSWKGCKFAVNEIEIIGELDRDWALDNLPR